MRAGGGRCGTHADPLPGCSARVKTGRPESRPSPFWLSVFNWEVLFKLRDLAMVLKPLLGFGRC